jgi:hypothetical protein
MQKQNVKSSGIVLSKAKKNSPKVKVNKLTGCRHPRPFHPNWQKRLETSFFFMQAKYPRKVKVLYHTQTQKQMNRPVPQIKSFSIQSLPVFKEIHNSPSGRCSITLMISAPYFIKGAPFNFKKHVIRHFTNDERKEWEMRTIKHMKWKYVDAINCGVLHPNSLRLVPCLVSIGLIYTKRA